jgi:D-alanyl-D-alanine-carboxypeptidase/D-alanyl-D-alanine-endopeptidase
MKRFLILLICFSIISLNTEAQSIKRIDGSQIDADSLSAAIRLLMKDAGVSGLGIVVYNENKPLFMKTFGLADVREQTPFKTSQVMYAASFSKTVFAYIVAQLVQEKVIDLDKPLVQYLTKPLPDYIIPGWNRGYQDIKKDKRYEKITARMCLSHTTGFPNWRWFELDEKIKIKFNPGSRYSYSGEGLYLLQFVIEQITGRDYESIARERVFIPLNMENTSYVWQPKYAKNLVLGHDLAGKPYEFEEWEEAGCAGTMCTTLEDYSRFFRALMQHKGLSNATFKNLITPQVRIRSIKQFGPLASKDSTLNDNIQLSYGLGLGVFKTPCGPAFFKEGHDEGWGHYSIAYPEKGIGVVIMTNNDAGESIFKQLLKESIGDIYTPWEWEHYIQ